MNKLLKNALVLVFAQSIATQSFASTDVNAASEADAFKKAVMMLGNGKGEWGGSYDARYFSSALEGNNKVYNYVDGGGYDGQANGDMDIRFSVNPKTGLLSYVYTVRFPSPSGTDQEVCQKANPLSPDDNSQDVRPAGTPLPRTIIFKIDAIRGGMAKAKAQIAQQVKTDEKTKNLSEQQQQKIINDMFDLREEFIKEQVVAGVEDSFSRESISKSLYQNPETPDLQVENGLLGNDVIAVIQGKKCNHGDQEKSWNELEDLKVPVIRAEIVDGELQMRAVVSPFKYQGQILQGFSIYQQTPGTKISK